MKVKSMTNVTDTVVFGPIPSDEDFELIKQFATGELDRDKLFVYKVLLCDNNTDRDLERFTHKALEQMTSLFVGKIGIEDHNPTAKNNHSRIYKTELVVDNNKTNDVGEPYEYLLGYAYTINNDKNKTLIEEIQSGLKKEVSVGVSCSSYVCSICHQDKFGCKHDTGCEYDGQICVGLMDQIDDVYEWSFVSIPSQRKAGVIKSKQLKEEAKTMSLKALALKIVKSAGVSSEDAEALLAEIDKIEQPDKATKALEDENKQLRDDLEKALKALDEGKARKTEELVDKLIDSLGPKNDKMKDLARHVIEELIEVDDTGALTEDSEKAICDELKSEEYAPMFNSEDDDEIDKSDDEIDKSDDEPVETKSKSYKSIDFSRTTRKSVKTDNETGVMGIRFRNKD